MGIEALYNDILEQGHAKASSILEKAKMEANEIISKAEKEAEKYKEAYLKNLEHELSQLKVQAIESAKLDSQRKILVAKKSIIEKVKNNEVISAISLLSKERNEKWVEELLRKASRTIHEGYIYMDKLLYYKLYSTPRMHIKHYEYKGALENSIGGIYLTSKDGEKILNMSYENLINSTWESHYKEFASMLFA
jgi:vacuolar-type H+-ATPase subunit E/Vma4